MKHNDLDTYRDAWRREEGRLTPPAAPTPDDCRRREADEPRGPRFVRYAVAASLALLFTTASHQVAAQHLPNKSMITNVTIGHHTAMLLADNIMSTL